MSDDQHHDGGLTPRYQTYVRQKCMIAYSEQAVWADDLLAACEEVLRLPEFDLEPDYARKHFLPGTTLREKALELIANARYGIYDLSDWQVERGAWHMPRNVLIELGMAIALNRPTLLLRHKSNRDRELPECLQSVSMLEFGGAPTLKRVLAEHLPQWIAAPPERDWWNRFCIFGGRICSYREAHPRAGQWGRKGLSCHISDGPDPSRDDFREVVEEELKRYGDLDYAYLDALPLSEGYGFALCSRCQAVRSSPFAIYRITPHTPAETFIAIGMSIALEQQFEYTIPKVLLVDRVEDVPSLLAGYEVKVTLKDRERKEFLRTFIPDVIRNTRETVFKSKLLPFVELTPLHVDESPSSRPARKDVYRILVADDDPSVSTLIQIVLKGPRYEVVMVKNGLEALKAFESDKFDVVILDVMMPYVDGFEVCQRIRERSDVPIIILTARDGTDDRVYGFELGADHYITKPFKTAELIARVESILRRVESYQHRSTPTIVRVSELELDKRHHSTPMIVRVGELELDERRHRVSIRGQDVNLTPMEFELLYFLAANAGHVFDRETLFREVWGYDYVGETNLVDVCVRRLREKLEVEPSRPRLVVTVRGVGYKLAAS